MNPSVPLLATRPRRAGTAVAVCAAALLAGGVRAQAPEDHDRHALQLAKAEVEREIRIFEGPGPLLLGMDAMGAERVVKGAPYCADAEHEAVQWLPDGSGATPNRIVRVQTSRLCRDSEGRTRQEIERGGRKVVYLRDPVARENWVLDPERKTARRFASGQGAMGHFDAGAMREFGERMREWARGFGEPSRQGRSAAAPPAPPAPPVPPTPPTPVLITRSDDGQRHIETRVLRVPGAGVAEEWAAPPPVQWRERAPRGAGTVTPLPAKDIEGLRVHGERTTWLIEAGKIGNERPIQIVHEVWTAPELMLTVSSRDFDPRSGEQNYRLKRVQRGEPDAALMRVPADFSQTGRPPRKASAPTG